MAKSSARKHGDLETIRDTVESIWVAMVSAFVLRAFLIEAFVIPTGSMAPRLMGKHWDLMCPSCGYRYAHGTPKEVDLEIRYRHMPHEAFCPNCGFCYGEGEKGDSEYVNSGDRVLVLKYLYNFREPQPWDVVVFRNPQDNRQNYIKRLVGLPGETIEIVHGDVFAKASDEAPWRIRRKGRRAQKAMWQIIFDNDYRPIAQRLADPDSPRWQPQPGALGEGWKLSGYDGRVFEFQASPQWRELFFQASRDHFLARYGYNSPRQENQTIDLDVDVCSDLKLEFTWLPKAADARVRLEFTRLDHRFRAEVGADGTVKVEDVGAGPPQPCGPPRQVHAIKVGRGCRIALTHADLRLTLWLDGTAVLQSDDQTYPMDYEALKSRLRRATAGDRQIPAPQVRIAAAGGPCELWHVRLMRDVYYTCPYLPEPEHGPTGDYFRRLYPGEQRRRGWATTGNPIKLRRGKGGNRDLDEFFVLGDNSPHSLDSRLWVNAAPTLRLYEGGDPERRLYRLGTVPRYLLIGKAFLVYWPSGFRLPGLPGLPLIPNVGKMRLIR